MSLRRWYVDPRWRNRSEFVNGRNESFALLSLKWSWTTGSSRNCGRSPGTAPPYAPLTNGTMTRVTGITPMAMRTAIASIGYEVYHDDERSPVAKRND